MADSSEECAEVGGEVRGEDEVGVEAGRVGGGRKKRRRQVKQRGEIGRSGEGGLRWGEGHGWRE